MNTFLSLSLCKSPSHKVHVKVFDPRIMPHFECDMCNKQFASRFSMKRHQEVQHYVSSETEGQTNQSDSRDEKNSETSDNTNMTCEEDDIDSYPEGTDDTSLTEEDREDSTSEDSDATSMTTEESGESHAEESDNASTSSEEYESDYEDSVFDAIVNQAVSSHEGKRHALIEKFIDVGMNEKEANMEATATLIPKYKKSLTQLFIASLLHMERMKNHPITKAIMRKVRKLESKSMDRDEAIRAAVSYRKHLVHRLFPSFNVTHGNMSVNEDQD